MVYQSKLGGSPTGDAVPAAQTKMMNYLMPIIFTIFFYGMPSGLVLYWLVNNVLSIVQQYFVQKEIDTEEARVSRAGSKARSSRPSPARRRSAGSRHMRNRSSCRA